MVRLPWLIRWPSRHFLASSSLIRVWASSSFGIVVSLTFDLLRGAALLGQGAAVNDELAPRHVQGIVGREVEDRGHDLIHRPHAAERHTIETTLQNLGVGHGAVEHL